MPCDWTLDDLAVYAVVAAELVTLCPFFKIEEITEKLEDFGFVQQTESERAAEMGLKDGGRES